METFTGTGGTAVLDEIGRTLTFTFKGSSAKARGGFTGPWVVPLGAIESVETKGGMMPSLRVVLRGRVGWHKDVARDLNGLLAGKEKPSDFADRIRLAMATATPCDPPADPRPAPLPKKPGLIMSILGNENW
ncbi:hypothetical protein FK529_05375 [Tsukamurella asaccharolytica]|uniref:DUF4429 domain-containing protein n=1 Tax=Tsukamurella asaccharolytica TaxID=2592067 RepID=A0A5C5RCW4_9ACTN|nr:hypothetical protein [Tsukamurella asaccharolytica]TWS20760.1 hypothetical protein FK529_05375 [Tsukamurella asaccharolytica]